jgi:transposase-like protein
MEDYPRTLAEFETRFSTEEACRRYLYQLRWPEGFICPHCAGGNAWMTERDLVVCATCGYHASVTAGTIFENTHKPLMLWFRAIWWMTSLKTGASALGLQRVLGLGSYKTAWTWLHKLRRAMVRPGRDRLSGRVEVDETYLGAEEKGLHGRQMQKKALIAVAAQEEGSRIGRIRMRRIPDASARSLEPFIEESIEPGSVVHTDGWDGYTGLEKKGYEHEVTILARRKESASELLPRVHHVVALLKTWLAGTLHSAVSHEHLDYYLDEFTFRFNRRTCRSRGKLFYRMVQQAVHVDPVPYQAIVRHVRDRRNATHKV